MKIRKMTGICMTAVALMLIAGCSSKTSGSAAEKNVTVETAQLPVDIVNQVESDAATQAASVMSEAQVKSYTILLDGYADQEAVYYLCEVTGDSSKELILGNSLMTVYSYNQGAVMTIGTLQIEKAYLSEANGFLAYYNNKGKYELRKYQYNGELFDEIVLVSETTEDAYNIAAAAYIADATELESYALDDRSVFE